MPLILDADSLIKLNRVGALELVGRVFECVIPTAVYQEAVVNARVRGYTDAEPIDKAITELIEVRDIPFNPRMTVSHRLGPGESEVMALAIEQGGDSMVVSDDLAFLNVIRPLGIRYVTPIALIPRLARGGFVGMDTARELIESSRRLTNERNYLAALADLEATGNGNS